MDEKNWLWDNRYIDSCVKLFPYHSTGFGETQKAPLLQNAFLWNY